MFLLWSHGFSMCSLQISVLFVLMRVEISLFSSSMLGCCGVFLLVQFLCVLFCCECLVVGVCLCCESYLLECISFLLGRVCW